MPGSQMAFTETQDEEESVATFPLQTVDGEQMEVGKYDNQFLHCKLL